MLSTGVTGRRGGETGCSRRPTKAAGGGGAPVQEKHNMMHIPRVVLILFNMPYANACNCSQRSSLSHAYHSGTRASIVSRLQLRQCVRALKGLAPAARESIRRDRPIGLTPPAFHACGSASPFAHAVATVAKIRTSATPILAQGRNTGMSTTAGYLRSHPIAQRVVHALKGLACRARVAPASSPASHCKQCSALTSPSLHARG